MTIIVPIFQNNKELVFYGISALVGYLIPNPVFVYMICKWIVCR